MSRYVPPVQTSQPKSVHGLSTGLQQNIVVPNSQLLYTNQQNQFVQQPEFANQQQQIHLQQQEQNFNLPQANTIVQDTPQFVPQFQYHEQVPQTATFIENSQQPQIYLQQQPPVFLQQQPLQQQFVAQGPQVVAQQPAQLLFQQPIQQVQHVVGPQLLAQSPARIAVSPAKIPVQPINLLPGVQQIPIQQVPLSVPIQELQRRKQVKGQSRIEYIPYKRRVIEYEQFNNMVIPREKFVNDHYAVEHVVNYEPESYLESYVDYVPVQKFKERTDYRPVENTRTVIPANHFTYQGIHNNQAFMQYQGVYGTRI